MAVHRTKRRSSHHDWTEAQQAGLEDGVERLLVIMSLGFEREVDHHDGVLLYDPDQEDDADESDDAKLGPTN